MFGLTKNAPQNQEANKNNSPKQNQASNFDADSAPIYTMQDDLERLKNPNAPQNSSTGQQAASSQRQTGNSPFLGAANENSQKFNQLENTSSRSKLIDTENRLSFLQASKILQKTDQANALDYKNALSQSKAYATSHINRRAVYFSGLAVVLLVLLSVVGYQLLNSKPEEEEPLAPEQTQPIETPIEKPTQPVEIPIEKPTRSYSETNPNYLLLEDGSLIVDKLKSILEKVSQEEYTTPVEFILTDKQNKPITFKSFSELLGLKLTTALLNLLGDNFSVFIYNDTTGPKIGLAIESKNDIELVKIILVEEKSLADEINPLFFNNTYNKTKLFNSSEYGGSKIRYQNIVSPEILSVDYSIYKNKLLIGTTKLTIRAIIDKLNGVKREVLQEISAPNETTANAIEKSVNTPSNQ